MKMVLCKICIKLAIAFLTLALSLSAFAGEFVGKVTKVSDGDTIWVVTDSGREKVRMDRIDAPEKDQPFGKEASEMLSGKIYGLWSLPNPINPYDWRKQHR